MILIKSPVKHLRFLFLIGLFSLFCLSLLTKIPSVWPDEALYIAIATKKIETLRAVSYWNKELTVSHSLFIFLLGIWLQHTVWSVFGIRLFSFVAGIVVVGLIYYLLQFLYGHNKSYIPILIVVALIIDPIFLDATRIVRPEIVVLLFGLSSLILLIKSLETKHAYESIIGGSLAGLACLVHVLGLIFLLPSAVILFVEQLQKSNMKKTILGFVLGIFFIVTLYLIVYGKDLHFLRLVFEFGSIRKSVDKPWIWWVFRTEPLERQIIYIFYIFISFLQGALILNWRQNKLASIVSVSLIASGWLFTTLGKTHWYFVYVVVGSYVSLSWLFFITQGKKIYKIFYLGLIVVVCINFKTFVTHIYETRFFSYSDYIQSLGSVIPEGKTIFLSSIPDPYIGLMVTKKYTLYEFPSLPTDLDIYRETLNNSDYIIFNGSFEQNLFGTFLQQYIKINSLRIKTIEGLNSYKTYVIELTSRNNRLYFQKKDQAKIYAD